MNKLVDSVFETFEDCKKILVAKNADYAGNDDPFRNFKSSELVGVPVERAILVRMMDKMSRISNLINSEAQVKDESLLDTCNDIVNYAAILKAYISLKNK